MEPVFLGILIFLGALAIFDLMVGVSNDAVNFMNSAVGAKAAKFTTIIAIAAVGVFIGAATSNGMMDIARHGIFQPEYFSFYDVMCIFLTVMVADVVILDIFNSLGLPTSTTISMVFELLGATFTLATIKIATADPSLLLDYGMLINTEKALSVILAIFLSVAIAFIAGTVVQYLSRLIFSFNYTKNLKYTIALYGGIAFTAIAYFSLVKGLKDSTFAADVKHLLNDNGMLIIIGLFVFFTILSQLLHILKVNVLKLIVFAGTFSLALAFAGNDLVNFIGVPLAALDSYQDYVANASGVAPEDFIMTSLRSSASTHWGFLLGAGAIMVYALITSKKAHNVIKTSTDLSRQGAGDEMFGSSSMARMIVRRSIPIGEAVMKHIPANVRNWIDTRFQKDEAILAEGAAFDLVRASVNLVLAGLLIIMGTSLKLPLSTTYITFIVAMGTSLADRAWARESAVFRITGVLSVIGGWFITAFSAFTLAALVALVVYYGGVYAMYAMVGLVIFVLWRSNKAFKKHEAAKTRDEIFERIITLQDKEQVFLALREHMVESQLKLLSACRQEYDEIVDGVIGNDIQLLRKAKKHTRKHKELMRIVRQRELVGMRIIDDATAIEYNTWFHLSINGAQQMMYSLVRVIDPCFEHVDNNFTPMPDNYIEEFLPVRAQVVGLIRRAQNILEKGEYAEVEDLLLEADAYNEVLSALRRKQQDRLQNRNNELKVLLVYLNIVQESQELLSGMRHTLRAVKKFVAPLS